MTLSIRRMTPVMILIAIVMLIAAPPYWTAAALVARAAGIGGVPGVVARWGTADVSDRLDSLTVRSGSLRIRTFQPSTSTGRFAILVAGVHRDGIDEPRLIGLARELAATGVTVVTPEIDDLVQYRLTPQVTDTIEDVALAMIDSDRSVGLIGVSFSGGLSIVAAGRPALRDRLAYVMSFGGHGNLPRVLNYLCTGVEPAGVAGGSPRSRPPHDYAVAVVAHQAAGLAVPEGQAGLLRQQIEVFLEASALKRSDPTRAAALFDAARAREADLPEPSLTIMRHINNRNVVALGRLLTPYLQQLGQDPSLSPDRSPPPSAPVYLLHGVDDNVIPAIESELLFNDLHRRTRTRLLLSRYLTHVDLAARPTLADTWSMIAFWKDVLSE